MDIEEVKKKISHILKEELAGKEFSAFFFGSRVSGTATSRSDLDVGIEGSAPLPLEILRSIRARTDALRTLYTVDVVDFSNLSDDFKKVAKLHTEIIV